MEFTSIGVVRSPFTSHQGTPIQSAFAADAKGEIVLSPEYVEALADLDGFTRIWLVYAFHRAGSYQARVVPYRDTDARGLFATRAPSRPNPIGISVLTLERIEENILYVAGIDMLDGTPVLDVKPYVPTFDSFPDGKAGWLDRKIIERRQADKRFER